MTWNWIRLNARQPIVKRYKYQKNENELCTFNTIKYYVISLVLDILVKRIIASNLKEVEISFEELMQEIWKNSTFDMKWSISPIRVELIVAEMSWMNLIVNTGEMSKNPNIKLKDEGYKAYQDQKYHSMAASLMEAKASRKLSVLAITLSVITLVITLISIFC